MARSSEASNLQQECAQVTILKELLADIDGLVGEQNRDDFLIEVLRKEVKRRQLLQMLSSSESFWKDEDHPELQEGSDVWVRRMRDEGFALEREN
jgi:hypothetical protein